MRQSGRPERDDACEPPERIGQRTSRQSDARLRRDCKSTSGGTDVRLAPVRHVSTGFSHVSTGSSAASCADALLDLMYAACRKIVHDRDVSARPSHFDALGLRGEAEADAYHEFVVRVVTRLTEDGP